ncbi:rhodanese-like domain-containing protein [Tessaracoccus coleopterorum]|uniref:rhodanese-like domain-containing protein n=1 Tax=Tessaracoccus coleopterorum TaxID=2714950 RepID=UPI0018D27B12|nr:rhodanese-like domain-containing protein [Tessaracoccus coleopterorum]
MGFMDFLGKRSAGGLSIEETLMALSKGAVLIDVRTPIEYESGHAPGRGRWSPRTSGMTRSWRSTATTRWRTARPRSS